MWVSAALLALDLRGKKVLLPGCGFGNDAIRLALMGAEVHASDLSTDLLEIARARAQKASAASIVFEAMPAEALTYADATFDAVFYNDILHHVDIPRALGEARRVLKPGATMVVNELYTHSALQRLRNSALVSRTLYPLMVQRIYGTDSPYITADERKLDERELDGLTAMLTGARLEFFLMIEGRLLPAKWPWLSRLDRTVLQSLGTGVGRMLADRFVLTGRMN